MVAERDDQRNYAEMRKTRCVVRRGWNKMLATICWTVLATKTLMCGPVLPVADIERRFQQETVITADGIDPIRIIDNLNRGLSAPRIVREDDPDWEDAEAAVV